ncbi:MAG: tyrosine-type recombinase/integrase, partial [Actinomycetota bacterium]|nr:tyrosine-type recombinase/integrase [Actinomycetota bacterium]
QQYNSAIRGLFRDLRRHLERAWVQHTGADPYAGDVWEVALLDLQPNGARRWPATQGAIDFRVVELGWLREVIKDWARNTRPYLQRLREALRACRVASQTLVAAGRTDPTRLGAGDFALIMQAISGQRRADGRLYSAAHRNLLVYMLREQIEHGRANGLMAQVPDPFGRGRHQRVVEDPNEDELGKALPESVIRQLDTHLHLLGPRGRAGSISAADLQAMHQTIYRILRDTGRRPGEVVSLRVGCIEVIDGQHNLIYDNHKAARRRRLPITADTAPVVLAWERHRADLSTPPATHQWLFPSPLLRARQSLGHLTANCVGRAFNAWMERAPTIDSEVLGPDGTPLPFDRSLVTPYVLRHSYAQRHADAGVPVDVLKELLDHAAIGTTMGYYSISLKRKQHAIRAVGSLAVDANGNPAPFAGALAYERASVSVPFGNWHRTLQRQGGRRALSDPVPVCGLRLLPARPLLPARHRRTHRQPARRQRDRPGHRRRRLRHRQPHRPNRRVHRRRREHGPPTQHPRRRPARRSGTSQPPATPRPRRPTHPPRRRGRHRSELTRGPPDRPNPRAWPPPGPETATTNANAPWPPCKPSKPPAKP